MHFFLFLHVSDIREQPYRDLFLFAVLNNFREMAYFFWNEGEEQIGAALRAATIYRRMARDLKGDNEHLKDESK